MRSLILTLGLLLGVLIAPAGLAAYAPAASAVVASVDAYQDQQPSAKIDVDINRGGGGGAWYTSPVWLAIGGLALVVLVLLVVSATRGGGGGTTVVRG